MPGTIYTVFAMPHDHFLAALLAVSLAGLVAGASLAGPLAATVTETLSLVRKRPLYGKCAFQIVQFTCVAGLLAGLLALGLGALYFFRPQPGGAPPDLVPLLLLTAPPATWFVLLCVYLFAWNALAELRGLRLLLGVLVSLLGLGLLAGLVELGLLGWLLEQRGSLEQSFLLALRETPLADLAPFIAETALSPHLPLLGAHVLTAALAAVGACTVLWLIVRRNRDDFGRDYYNFAMRYCSRWALVWSLLSAGACALAVWRLTEFALPGPAKLQTFWYYGPPFVLPLLACAVWAAIARSATPMRHKFAAALAFLLLAGAWYGQILLITHTVSAP